MDDRIALIESCEVEVRGGMAYVTSVSGKRTVLSAMERHAMREYLHRAIRVLDDADIADESRIIEFRLGGCR